MEQIQISLGEVADTAAKLRSLNERMYEVLTGMLTEMNTLSNSWISDGSEEIRQRFRLFAERFEEEREVIEAYAAFLDLTVSTYESLETSIANNASGVQY